MTPMRLYLAGTCTFGIAKGQSQYRKCTPKEAAIADAIEYRLESYHYVGNSRKVNELRAAGVKVFLDSGAFSAKSLGISITVEDYCKYIHENSDLIEEVDGIKVASVLDEIDDPLKTYQNQLHMESLGVRPLPCFHQGEDERYLEYYVANYDFITIGGIVGGNKRQLQIWMDRIWSRYLIDGAGNPKVRVHGFGMTSVDLMERYPWFSCDSSTWIQNTGFGSIQIPGYGVLDLSDESPNRHNAGKHLKTLTPIEYERVKKILADQGFDIDEVQSRYLGRCTYNIWAFEEIARMINRKKQDGHREIYAQELF